MKVTQRSFIDGGWCMVDILSLELTLNLVATFPPPIGHLIFTMFMAQMVRGSKVVIMEGILYQ